MNVDFKVAQLHGEEYFWPLGWGWTSGDARFAGDIEDHFRQIEMR